MQTRAFTIFSKKDLAAIHSSLDSLLSLWVEKWFISTVSSPTVTAVSNAYETSALPMSSDDGSEESIDRHRADGGACRLVFPAQMLQQIYCRATGDRITKTAYRNQAGTVESGLSRKVLDDLLAMLLPESSAAEPANQSYPKGQSLRPQQADWRTDKGSGTVVATIAEQDSVIHLILSQSLAQSLSGNSRRTTERTSLTPRKSVIGHGTLKIQVSAGEAELRLSDLVGLLPGHVVRLNLQPDQPFTVETADTRLKLCDAHLGQRDGNKAIQLINQ